MARIWVKAGEGKKFDIPLRFRVQGQITDKDTPAIVNADGNVTQKLRDGSLVRCKAPAYIAGEVDKSGKVNDKPKEKANK